MTGADTDGTQVASGTIRLRNAEADRLVEAERKVYDLAVAHEGPPDVSSVSSIVTEDESREATETGMLPLIGLAFLLIAILLLLFLRSLSDLLLTFAGLFLALIWVIGAEGLLGPDGLGLVGPPNALTAMVPIIMIGLTVDYAIQTVSHYREKRVAGGKVVAAVQTGLRNVTIPLVLAAAYVDALLQGVILRREPVIPMEAALLARHKMAVDCTKAVSELGLPQSSIVAALEKSVRWFQDHGYV